MFTKVGYKSCYLSEGTLSILLGIIFIYLSSVGCMDKTSTRKYRDQNLGHWVINDTALTANLYEIAKQTFPFINKLDTTKFAMELCGNQAEYLLFFSDKATLGKLYGGEGYVVIFRREDLMPIDLKRTQ
jgi:hypothetical protein